MQGAELRIKKSLDFLGYYDRIERGLGGKDWEQKISDREFTMNIQQMPLVSKCHNRDSK